QQNSDNVKAYAIASQLLVAALIASHIILTGKMLRTLRTIRMQERLFYPDIFQAPIDQPGSEQRDYKSQICLAGVPLFHFRFGMPESGDKPVVAWIAGGTHAYGLVFAWEE